MTESPVNPDKPLAAALIVRRRIQATPEKLFAAWTEPSLLVRWWGPQGVACPSAEVDLRVGGAYRIANQFADGTVLWITGVFEVIERPRRLIYTWKLESRQAESERVTVCFEAAGEATDVVVTHERIPDEAARTSHERGWHGCLDGLSRFAEVAAGSRSAR